MKVLITRAEPAASQTAANLAKKGHEAIVLPVFEVVDTQNNIPEKNYDGIIFTSKNAVDVLKSRAWKLPVPDMPAFCVGEKTEKAAQRLGFKETYSANGGGAALTDLMSTMKLEDRKMLYLSTPDKSFDIKKALATYKIDVETVDIYQARPVTPNREQLTQAISVVRHGAVFTYSALSSEHLAKLIKSSHMIEELKECTLISISSQASKPLELIDWKDILIAQSPKENEMIALIN